MNPERMSQKEFPLAPFFDKPPAGVGGFPTQGLECAGLSWAGFSWAGFAAAGMHTAFAVHCGRLRSLGGLVGCDAVRCDRFVSVDLLGVFEFDVNDHGQFCRIQFLLILCRS